MHITTDAAHATFAVVVEQALQFAQQIGLGPEVTEVVVALRFRQFHSRAHLDPVVAMKRVAFDDLRLDTFAAKDVRETHHDGGGAGAAGAGDRDDRMLG